MLYNLHAPRTTAVAADAVHANDVISIGEIAHFQGDFADDPWPRAMANDIKTALGLPDTRVKYLVKDGALSNMGQDFAETYLLPRLSRAAAGGKLQKLDNTAQALRLTVVVHSFGSRIIAEAGQHLMEQMQSPERFETPYTAQEAKAACEQLLVAGFGAAMDYDVAKMLKTNRDAYTRLKSPFTHLDFYGEREGFIDGLAAANPDAFLLPKTGHGWNDYARELAHSPDLAPGLKALADSGHLQKGAAAAPFDASLLKIASVFLKKLRAINGVTVQDDTASYSLHGKKIPILTISGADNTLSLDPAPGQRENCAKAMNDNASLQHFILENPTGLFSGRAQVMARRQIEAKIKKGSVPDNGPQDRQYDFEDRIRSAMPTRAIAPREVDAKFSRPESLVFGFTADAPDGFHAEGKAANRKRKDDTLKLKSCEPSRVRNHDIITIGGLDHFQGKDSQRLKASMKFPAELAELLGAPPSQVKGCLYNTLAKEAVGLDDHHMAGYLADHVLLPCIGKKMGRKWQLDDPERAAANLRLNFFTHSFGGKLLSLAMIDLAQKMQDARTAANPYTAEQAERVCSQVLQVDLGAALGYNWLSEDEDERIAFKSPATRLQLYLRKDPEVPLIDTKIRLGKDDIAGQELFLIDPPAALQVSNRWGSPIRLNDGEQHCRQLYIESLRAQPALVAALRDAVAAPQLDKAALLPRIEAQLERLGTPMPAALPTLEHTSATPLSTRAPASDRSRA